MKVDRLCEKIDEVVHLSHEWNMEIIKTNHELVEKIEELATEILEITEDLRKQTIKQD